MTDRTRWAIALVAGLALAVTAHAIADSGHPAGPVQAAPAGDGTHDAEFALAFVARHDAGLAARLREPFGTLLAPPGATPVSSAAWAARSTRAEVAAAIAAAANLRDAIAAHRTLWGGDPGFERALATAQTAAEKIGTVATPVPRP